MIMSHDPSPNCATDEIMQVMFMIDSTTCTTLFYEKKEKEKESCTHLKGLVCHTVLLLLLTTPDTTK
jgi:hypothetical protein